MNKKLQISPRLVIGVVAFFIVTFSFTYIAFFNFPKLKGKVSKTLFNLDQPLSKILSVKIFSDTVIQTETTNKEEEKQIIIDPTFISAIEIINHKGTPFLEIRSLNVSGEFENIYHENLNQENGSVYITNSMPLLFVSRYSKPRKNTEKAFIDFVGKKQEDAMLNALIDQHTLPSPDGNSLFYINPKQDGDKVENEEALFETDLNGNIIHILKSNVLPLRTTSSTRLVGWSSDYQSVYATRIGWEGFEYSDLWKINITTDEVEPIIGAKEISLGALSVLPNKDLAVGIKSTEVPCFECFGPVTTGAPAAIILFDLKNNSSKTIYTSPEKAIYYPIISPDGSKIFFSEETNESEWTVYTLKISTGELEKISESENLVGMSNDGNRIILAKEKSESEKFPKYRVLNLLDKSENSFEIYLGSRDYYQRFLKCDYPLGFSCLYD